MARRIRRFDVLFASEVQKAVEIALAGERLRSLPGVNSAIRKELPMARIEALYETAYLRVFLRWEDFLEETFLRYLCGHTARVGQCVLINAPFVSLSNAKADVLGKSNFVNWADPVQVIARSKKYMNNGFHETVIQSDFARIVHFKAVRNRIAHSSEHARDAFDAATRALVSKRYPGSSAGRFLREVCNSSQSQSPRSWLEEIADELRNLAAQIC